MMVKIMANDLNLGKQKPDITCIREFKTNDAEDVSVLIYTTLRTSLVNDYSPEYIEEYVNLLQPEEIIRRAEEFHTYVAEVDGRIIGCGSIGPFWGSEEESGLFTIFVHPEYQRRGIGRKLIETLEGDEFFLRAKRVEVPASITATPFYLKMGYHYKNGITEPDEEQLIRLEKFHNDSIELL